MRYFIFLIFFCANGLHAGEPDKNLHNKCLYPTVMIEENLYALDKGPSKGTGVIFSTKNVDKVWKNKVLTVAHVIFPKANDDPKAEVEYDYSVKRSVYKDWSKFVNYESFKAKVLALDRIRDLAILEFESKEKMPVAEIDWDAKLYIGNDISSIGHGLGRKARLDYGKVTSLDGERNTHRMSVPSTNGDSGGPVFEGYKVIGIRQAMISRRYHFVDVPVAHISFYIPIQRAKESTLLKDHLD